MSLRYTITNEKGEVYVTGKIWLENNRREVLVTDDEGDILSIETIVEDAEIWDEAHA